LLQQPPLSLSLKVKMKVKVAKVKVAIYYCGSAAFRQLAPWSLIDFFGEENKM
jgi:hypothetical protein